MSAIGRNGCLLFGLFGYSLCITIHFMLITQMHTVESAARRFDYILIKRSNASGNTQMLERQQQRPLTTDELDRQGRINTIVQFLEHRPPPQSCYKDRPRNTYRFHCPSPSPDDVENGWPCITIDDLCNNIPDCPGAEDEDLVHCMFFMAVQHQTQTLRQIIVRHYEQVHTMPNTVRI